MTGQFLSSHDEDGFKASLMNGKKYTEDKATSAALVAATLQLTAKGIPVIYYGEEVGLSGLNNYPYQTNRYDMDFSKATKDNVTYQHYKNLLSIRNAYTDVFARGSRNVVASSDEVAALSSGMSTFKNVLIFVNIVIVFVVCFLINYTTKFMFEKRSKEFGTYMLLGIKKHQSPVCL